MRKETKTNLNPKQKPQNETESLARGIQVNRVKIQLHKIPCLKKKSLDEQLL